MNISMNLYPIVFNPFVIIFGMCIMHLSNLKCVFLSEKCLYLINNVIECLYYVTLETCQDASYGLYKFL
jgi:hypothetical protein